MARLKEVSGVGQRKHREVLSSLLEAIGKRDGTEKVDRTHAEVKDMVLASMDRETILQFLSRECPVSRIRFLMLYPEYIAPYLFRVRNNQG